MFESWAGNWFFFFSCYQRSEKDFVTPFVLCYKENCARMVLLREITLIFCTGNLRMNASLMCSLSVNDEFVLCCLFVYILLPFLNERRLILLLTQAKAQVLCLLLSHWVGQWIKPLYVSTAALCLLVLSSPRGKTESLLLRSIVHMLASSYLPCLRQHREFAENEFNGNLSFVSSSSLQPVENCLFWSWCCSAVSRDCYFHVSVFVYVM